MFPKLCVFVWFPWWVILH